MSCATRRTPDRRGYNDARMQTSDHERAPRLFGTDGVRSVFHEGPLTSENIVRLGRALARFAAKRAQDAEGPRVLLAADPRPSGPELVALLSGALAAEGARVIDMGIVPTPALAWGVVDGGFDLGCMVSASHNAVNYNGVKPFVEGRKLTVAEEAEIEAEAAQVATDVEPLPPVRDLKARGRFIDRSVAWLRQGGDLEGVSLVVDLAAGAATDTAPAILEALGATVTTLHPALSRDINDGCGSEQPDAWLERVVAASPDAGFAFDGDADRVVLATPDGVRLDGDDMLAILAEDAYARGVLSNDVVVSSVMSNLGLEERLRSFGVSLERAPVGDRNVAEHMRAVGASFGGEPSGHILMMRTDVPAPFLVGDALAAGVAVLQAARRLGRSLGELRAARPRYPQLLVGVTKSERRPIAEWPELSAEIARQEEALAGTGRLVIRYSGTEPLLRIMAEGRDEALVEAAVRSIQAVAERDG